MDTHTLIDELTHDPASHPDIVFALSTMDGLPLRFDETLRYDAVKILLENMEMEESSLALILRDTMPALEAVPYGFRKGQTLGEICRVLQLKAEGDSVILTPFTPVWEDGFLIKDVLSNLGYDFSFYGTDDCSDPEEVYVVYKK